jgi:hypothetical protein
MSKLNKGVGTYCALVFVMEKENKGESPQIPEYFKESEMIGYEKENIIK